MAHGGVRRERVASPAWTIANLDASGGALPQHTITRTHDLVGDDDPTETFDTYELWLRNTAASANMFVRTVPLSRSTEPLTLADLQARFVEHGRGEAGWLVDLETRPASLRYDTRLVAEAACSLDGSNAQEFVYEATLDGETRLVHVVLAHLPQAWLPEGRADTAGNRLRAITMLGLSVPPEAYGELVPEFADLVQRVRLADGSGASVAAQPTTCGALRPVVRAARFRVGDRIVYRHAGQAVGGELLEQREVTEVSPTSVTVEVTLRQADAIVRRWAEERTDDLDHPEIPYAALPLISVCVFEGDSCREVAPESLATLEAGVHLVHAEVEPTPETRTIAGQSFDCSVQRGAVTEGRRSLHFEETMCARLPWRRAGLAVVDARTGDVVHAVTILELRGVR